MDVSNYTPTYAVGQRVQAVASYAHKLVAGEVYTVVDNTPPEQFEGFRFPEYTTVEAANGARSSWYPWRFRPV